MLPHDFIVVDTEGKDILREIAVVNHEGKLIYEAIVEGAVGNEDQYLNLKTLNLILEEFRELAEGKVIVCHKAAHDRSVIQKSYGFSGLQEPSCNWICTYDLAKQTYPDLGFYSLGDLSLRLHLKLYGQYFSETQAHAARYDALFTYQLYKHMTTQTDNLKQLLQPYQNPFGSSRVDNPFQTHPDLKSVSQQQYEALKSVLEEIKNDPNRQSRGVVITGEAGTGKSHLMMRLAQERLERNRLFFINHPNNPEGVLFHIYSRVLESLIERVGDTEYTQLDHLLAHFLSKIINRQNIPLPTQKEAEIIEALEGNPLEVFEKLGGEDTNRKRDFWDYIEKKVEQWWQFTYNASGLSAQVLRGILRYCRYTDPNRKLWIKRWLAGYELEPQELELVGLVDEKWDTQTTRETLGQEALVVFGKLSLLDEPLIIVFDQLESLAYEENANLLTAFGEGFRELFTHVNNSLFISIMFPESWRIFQERLDGSVIDRQGQIQLTVNSPDRVTLERLLEVQLEGLPFSANDIFTTEEKEEILNQRVIRKVINRAADYYRFKRDGIPVPSLVPTQQQQTNTQIIFEISQDLAQVSKTVEELSKKLNTLLVQKTETVTPSPLPSPQPGSVNGSQTPVVNTEVHILYDYLKAQKQALEAGYRNHDKRIITTGEDRSCLQTVLTTCHKLYGFDIDCLKIPKKKTPDNLVVIQADKRYCVAFLYETGTSFASRMKNMNQLVVGNPGTHFSLLRDPESPGVSGKVGQAELEKYNYCNHTTFVEFGMEYRVPLELFENMIIDIQNRDLEVNLNMALLEISNFMPDSWIVRLLKGERPF
ncbi:hypothetical protein AWQ21_02240 [Picosynechococcus sp. PCC 7003]|uniref:hypothetical protein n=1 Tax=Picosynechococcus sp. PCC 7003 TaxID=374981 RepID=UPI00081040E9|nr:hypothetical protein [Picosynechococcus sp. PCC 7003]ANV83299.1 hypothetical protein AWQ21_02240 [Picosynechococcus sp. PCC 7003]